MNTSSTYRIAIAVFASTILAAALVVPARAEAQDLIVSGVLDGPLPGGLPKAIEIYVVSDVANLSEYGVSSANNGGGPTGAPEFTFPAISAGAGSYLYIATETVEFQNFFGFAPDFTSGSAASINGDDAIELFQNGVVVDVFGDVNVDGTGEPWDHLDGWAYRNSETGPDGNLFVLGNWFFSGTNALDGETSNATAATPFPLGTFSATAVGGDVAPRVVGSSPAEGDSNVAFDADINIIFNEPVTVSGAWFDLSCAVSGAKTATVSSADSATFVLDPDSDFAEGESCSLTVFAANVSDIDAEDPPDNPESDFVLTFQIAAAGVEGIVINEIHADPEGSLAGDANGDGTRDSGDDEFVEIVNTTGGPLDVSGWTVSDAVSVRHVFPAGTVIDDGCAIVVFGGGTPTGAFGGALVQTASSNSLGLNNGGDTVTLNDGASDVAVQVYGGEGGNDQSLTRDPDLTGAFVQHLAVSPARFSPGTRNDGATFAGCALVIPQVAIYDVQGSGTVSPFNGQTVTVEGIVTGDFQNGDADTQSSTGGFYLQDAVGDGDPATSDGIYIFDGNLGVDVNVGDVVQVTGSATEFFGETQISATTVSVVASGAAIAPVELELPSAGVLPGINSTGYIADLERFEGMLVRVSQPLTVGDLFNLDRFGEISLLAGGRAVQFTNNNAPDVEGFDASLQALAARRLMLDDGLTVQNPDPIRYPPPGLPNDVGSVVRSGDMVSGLTGNIRYSRGSGGSGAEMFRLMPTEEPVFTTVNARPTTPPAVAGSVKVASFNVLNFFSTIDVQGSECGPLGLDCRGADSQEELDRQLAKIVSALVAIDADIVGLIEIENSTGESLQTLVDALNGAIGSEVYGFVDTGFIGTDAIQVAFIYRTDTIAAQGGFAILDSSVDARFLDQKNRPVLAQTFIEIESAGVFTVAVNHLKSKGSDCEDVGDADSGDGQGNCNGTRTLAAQATVDWLATDPTGSGDADVIVIGDLNAYLQEDPINAYRDGGYANLLDLFVGGDAYTFMFDAQIGALDHALANASALEQVADFAIWHSNADEADALDYNLDFGRNPAIFEPVAARASDHDAVIVGLNLVGDADGDGVPNAQDVCAATRIPEDVPALFLIGKRWALTDGDFTFDTGRFASRFVRNRYTTTDTAGCSCEQIIERVNLGPFAQVQRLFGCSDLLMRYWIAQAGH